MLEFIEFYVLFCFFLIDDEQFTFLYFVDIKNTNNFAIERASAQF